MNLRPRTVIARKLRRDSTDVERPLWRALRESAMPWRFRRQHPIGERIADFACPARKLVSSWMVGSTPNKAKQTRPVPRRLRSMGVA
jgi:very-short-patch-repair endonuclease